MYHYKKPYKPYKPYRKYQKAKVKKDPRLEPVNPVLNQGLKTVGGAIGGTIGSFIPIVGAPIGNVIGSGLADLGHNVFKRITGVGDYYIAEPGLYRFENYQRRYKKQGAKRR